MDSEQSSLQLAFEMEAQPTQTSCGPTCLAAVYRYYSLQVETAEVIDGIPELETGGTLAVQLGIDALARGFRAALHTQDLRVFDPSWFPALPAHLAARLEAQIECREEPKLRFACRRYLRFLELGGRIELTDFCSRLVRRLLNRGIPILTGLCSSALYRAAREIPETGEDDDLRGEPAGHFVVLYGYDRSTRQVWVADPYEANPLSGDCRYRVSMDRLLNAILLGVLTYDANLLVLERSQH
jgi:hypothetical protein